MEHAKKAGNNRLPPLTIHLCTPRGFCAGVDRAIQIVEIMIKKYGPPVYIRHEIVHNRYVVETLENKGAIFVENLDEIPQGKAPVIFSAHGVPKSILNEAKKRNMIYWDAICPLVSKVHTEAQNLYKNNYDILLIGHAGHPEVIGTMGQLPTGAVRLIETIHDAEKIAPRIQDRQAIITQTTLSVDDTHKIIQVLKKRFPDIKLPQKEDICYATTNRQNAVKKIANTCDAMIIVGAPNSSNSQRLRQVAERCNCKMTFLIQRAKDINWEKLPKLRSLGLTASASAPEILVEEVVETLQKYYTVTVEPFSIIEENIAFSLPRGLRDIQGQ